MFNSKKPILNVNFTLSAYYELLKSTSTLSSLFSFCMMFGMYSDNVSVLLNSVAVLRPFSDVERYNYMLICVYCKA